jgi:hypothetical protein
MYWRKPSKHDLDEAISVLEGASCTALDGWMYRVEILTSLWALFRARFRKVGGVGNLDRSIRSDMRHGRRC